MKYKILWYSDYYDGPLSGLVSYEGAERWFGCFVAGGWRCTICDDDAEYEYDDCWIPRVYQIIELSTYEMLIRKIRHWMFVKMVQEPRNYKRMSHKLFYKLFKPTPKYSNHKVLGAFYDIECWYE